MEFKTSYKELENKEKHGIELYFETKPTEEERNYLKNNGYKWHSVKKCWYKRIRNSNSKEIRTQNEKPAIELGVEKMENSYTGYGWQGVNSKKGYSMKEIAKLIKGELKRKYADCTFSVTKGGNAYCSTLDIHLMKSQRNPFADYETAVNSETFVRQLYGNNEKVQEQYKRDLKNRLESGYMQVSHYDSYCLSDFGKELFKYIFDLCNSFNYDDSDGQIDYFSCGFYDSMSIGKWDKKFELIKEV